MLLRLASRKSDLARLQTQTVAEALRNINPKLEFSFNFRESLGDQNQEDPLWKMPSKGVFTEDFTAGLINGDFDMVVHSWKDLPTELRPETEIIATLPRADVRDVLVVPKKLWDSGGSTLPIFSSSPRREHNLKKFLQDHLPRPIEGRFEVVRGNVNTRLRKALEQNKALVIAKAALDRLLTSTSDEYQDTRNFLRTVLQECYWTVIPCELSPPAAAQGALAIEVKKSCSFELKSLLQKVNCAATFKSASAERLRLAKFGGGCHLKLGLLNRQTEYGEVIWTKGLTPQNEEVNSIELRSEQTLPPAASAALICPATVMQSFSVREPIASPQIKTSADSHNYYIAKAEALTADLKNTISRDSLLWTSGLTTWQKLARQGFWINGSDESLGEELPFVTHFQINPQPWLKLTHSGASLDSKIPSLFTYTVSLSPNAVQTAKLYTHFYWRSGSLFEQLLKEWPELKNLHHACGPGSTRLTLSKVLGKPANVFLSEADWLDYLKRA